MRNQLGKAIIRRNSDRESAVRELADLIHDGFNPENDLEDSLFNIGLEPDYIDDLVDFIGLCEESMNEKGIEDVNEVTIAQVEEWVTNHFEAYY